MNESNLIDISMELNEDTVVWVEDDPPQLEPMARMPEDDCNFTWLDFGAHAGTHIDTPYYLFPDGQASDDISLSRLMGLCQVLDLTDVSDMITADDLRQHDITRNIVLLRTANSFDPLNQYNPQHVALSRDGAEYLVKQDIDLLGYDYQSFERDGRVELHRLFLSHDVLMLDNLRLAEADAGRYELICLPLKVTGIDAAPARAVLVDE